MSETRTPWAERFEAWEASLMANRWKIVAGLLGGVVVVGMIAVLFMRTSDDGSGRVRVAPEPEQATRLKKGDPRQEESHLDLGTPSDELTAEEKARIRTLFLTQGLNAHEIARSMGVSRDLVEAFMATEGLQDNAKAERLAAQKKQDEALKALREVEGWDRPGRELVVTPHDPVEADGVSPEREAIAASMREKYQKRAAWDPPAPQAPMLEPLSAGTFVAHVDEDERRSGNVLVPGTFFEARLEGRVIGSFFAPIVFARVFDQDGHYIGRAIGKCQLKRHIKNRAFMNFSAIYRPNGEVIQGGMIAMDRDLAEGIYGKADRKTLGTMALVAAEAFMAALAIDTGGDGDIWDVFRVNLSQNLIQDARQRLGDVDLSRVVELERDQSFIIAVTSMGRTKEHEAHPLSSAQALRDARDAALKSIPPGQSDMSANLKYAMSELEKVMGAE